MRAGSEVKLSPAYFSPDTISKTKHNSRIIEKTIVAFPLAITGIGIILGCLSLSLNSLDSYPAPLLGILGTCLLGLFLYYRYIKTTRDWKLVILSGFSLVSSFILSILPQYLYGFQINGIIHRSLISAIILLAVSIPAFCLILYYFLGATPKAHDLSRYPLIILPVVVLLAAYSILIFRIFAFGIPHLDWQVLTTPFKWQDWTMVEWQDDWPVWVGQSLRQTGILNHVLGTLLLIGLTAVISLPIGMGVGIYITEYATGWLAKVIHFSCNALRSISVFILGLIAMTVVRYTYSSFLSPIFAGYFYDMNGDRHVASGSFFLASIIISLLVIPIIARATEEGIRSTPQEMKEGSLSLGASPLYTLAHVLLPWSMPNIITGLLLGCAEASGSLATIWFISGTGQYGIGPFNQVTSLSYFIYFTRGDIDANFRRVEGIYQFSAAVILVIITMGLSIAVVILKNKLSQRYKGT